MDGTVEDWVHLRERTRALATVLGPAGVDLFPWFVRLDDTLAQLVATAQHVPDVTFWQHAYSSRSTRGSGAATYLTGWFLHFFDAKRGEDLSSSIDMQDLPRGNVSVPFKWELLSGEERKFTLRAGTWTAQVSADGIVFATPQWSVTDDAVTKAATGAALTRPWTMADASIIKPAERSVGGAGVRMGVPTTVPRPRERVPGWD